MQLICFRRLTAAVIFCLLFLSGCGKSENPDSASTQNSINYHAGVTQVLIPKADEAAAVGTDPLLLDFSFSDQGYFMGKLTEAGAKINIQVTGPDDVVYKYFLEEADTWTAFPFTAGSGPYLVLAFEEVSAGQYATIFSSSPDVSLENEFLPFLYPNQYVNFTAQSSAVRLAADLSKDAETDLDALNQIYRYVTEHITYDDEKAATVETGYLPDIDETLRTGTGICFDYAALTAAMLRSLSIPTRLDIGYTGDIRHAWIDVYIESIGWVEHAIEFNGDEWKFMDPTFASAGGDSEEIRKYIGDGSNYTLQYVR